MKALISPLATSNLRPPTSPLLGSPPLARNRWASLILGAALLLAPGWPALAATVRYASSSNRIYVEGGGGSVTLSGIKQALPNAPLDLVDAANQIWLLRAYLFVVDGSGLILHGSAAGGDVNELRLQSLNSSATNSVIYVVADWGTIDIKSTRITSWDSAANGPDTEFAAFGRAFIRVRSKLDADGVTPRESRMDIVDSDISFLGYDATESYGLSWKVVGTHPNPAVSIYDVVNVYGNITGSHIHDSYWGVYTFGLEGGQWLNNEIDHNAGYGFDPHDDSDHLLIEGNNVHHNGGRDRGTHGIIASMRCDHLVIRNNRSWANAENGIMVHRHSDDCVIENNSTYLNGDSGIAIFDTDRTLVRNNLILSNGNAGIRLTVGCSDNVIANNEIAYSGVNGLLFLPGTDPPEPDPVDPTVTNRDRRNTVSSNYVHHCQADAVRQGDCDANQFIGNVFSDNAPTLSCETSTQILWSSNAIPDTVTVALSGSTGVTTSVFFERQPLVHLALGDSKSTATFQDDFGAIFDFDQDTVATHVDAEGSFATLTSANVGTGTTAVMRNFFARISQGGPIPPGGVLINPTFWETGGDLRKWWTVQSGTPDLGITYTVGDLAANASYNVVKGGQTVATLTSDAAGRISFSDTPGAASAVQYQVNPGGTPPPLPTVTIVASDANASEAGPDPGSFTFNRTGATDAALTVNYSLGGTAVNGTDYAALSGSLTIPAGSGSAAVTITPIDDAAVEGNETVLLTLSSSAAYTVGSPGSASVTIADNDSAALPVVTVMASDANASEAGPDPGSFTFNRTGATDTALTVNYFLGGTAANGSDYSTAPSSVTIPAGSASASLTINPLDDTAVEGSETVTVTLSSSGTYTVGSPASATVTISDNDSPALPTVTVVASDPNASEAGPDQGMFTVNRTGAIETALTVNYSLGGAAVNGTDYSALSGNLTIAAGRPSASVTINPIDDAAVEGSETVVLTISSSAAYTVGSPGSATVTIAENDSAALPIVTVGASDPNASETASDQGMFTVSRTGAIEAALIVNYSLGGTAVNGADYSALSGSLTFAAGRASASVTINPIDDTTVEGSETVVLTLLSSASYSVGSPSSASVTIADNDSAGLPVVTVVASDANASEAGPDPGTFTVSRSAGMDSGLVVNYSLSGTAANGGDYAGLSGSLTIPAGSASANVQINPIDDTAVEGSETVVLTLMAGSGYSVGAPGSATVTIADNDSQTVLPTVSLTAIDANASEANSDQGMVVFNRTGALEAALTVRYSLGGTAANGSDYALLSGSVTLAAGRASATVVVNPIDDTAVEGNETVVFTLLPDAAYQVGSPSSATVTIADNDSQPTLPIVSVVASDANASEGGSDSGSFTVSRAGATTASLTVNYTLGGTALNGTDYSGLSGIVFIAAGSASASVIVNAIADVLVEPTETVVMTLSPNAAYTVGSPASATVSIADNNAPPVLPTVSVTTPDANAAEAKSDQGMVVFNRTGTLEAALTVRYSLGGTAANGSDYAQLSGSVTLAAGRASATVVVNPIDDAAAEGNETVIFTILPDAAYQVGSPSSATVTIVDNDQPAVLPVVTVVASVPTVLESGHGSGAFTFSRTGPTNAPLTVNYSIGGTAANGKDYSKLSGHANFSGGNSSVIIRVRPRADNLVEGNETVVVTLSPDPTYAVGSPNNATVTITDGG